MKWLRRWFGLDDPGDRRCRDGEVDKFAEQHERIVQDQRARLRRLEAEADLMSRQYPKGEQ